MIINVKNVVRNLSRIKKERWIVKEEIPLLLKLSDYFRGEFPPHKRMNLFKGKNPLRNPSLLFGLCDIRSHRER
jgi:hypothetical protein